jgi:hypothetical protein
VLAQGALGLTLFEVVQPRLGDDRARSRLEHAGELRDNSV